MSVQAFEPTDREIVRLCRHGAEAALRELLDRHYLYVLKLCWRVTGSRDEALDLTQEVFARMLTSLPVLDPQPSLRPWLRRVALNLCLSAASARGRGLRDGSGGEGNCGGQWASGAYESDPVAEAVVARDRFQRVAAAVQLLSPVQRAVVVLRAVDGLSHGRIAELLQLPEGTVKSHLSRARAVLRRVVTEAERE